jgi:hypothetical protein
MESSRLRAAGLAALAVVLTARPAELEAKASFDSPYSLNQTYNAALRLLRVDLGLTITERDPTVAYLLFDYKSPETSQRVVPGSIQMLEGGGKSVKVIVQLGQMPRYHEQVISEALERKLRNDYGEPTPHRPDPPDGGPSPSPPPSP